MYDIHCVHIYFLFDLVTSGMKRMQNNQCRELPSTTVRVPAKWRD